MPINYLKESNVFSIGKHLKRLKSAIAVAKEFHEATYDKIGRKVTITLTNKGGTIVAKLPPSLKEDNIFIVDTDTDLAKRYIMLFLGRDTNGSYTNAR